MATDREMALARIDAVPAASESTSPSTPPEAVASSQQSIPSTEGPSSPVEAPSALKTEAYEERIPSSQTQVIPSSLTPPPSTQAPQLNGAGAGMPLGISTQRSSILSPPATTAVVNGRRDRSNSRAPATEYAPPTAEQITDAPADELRAMVQSCLADNARLKMETAHHKLQYNLLSMQAEEDAKRAAVEHDMTRREVEALRVAEDSRQARRDLSAAAESSQVKYLQMKVWYDAAMEDNKALSGRLRAAKKIIHAKQDEILCLVDERDMLLNRIRENREHFHMLCSPGGAFHGALTPKLSTIGTPQQQHRTTPRQTPKSAHRDARNENDPNQAGFAALLQALSHDNNSAPSTPTTAHRPTPRMPARHTRGAQSLSSLPTTPSSRARGNHAGLLPSVDLVPQTEPATRYGNNRYVPETPTSKRGRKSRESTISADENEDISRAALQSVAAATSSLLSQGSRRSQRSAAEEEEVYESQASQAASDMLRRDPRESFEVASSVGSRDGTPAPAEKSAKLQSKLFAGVNKAGLAAEKRKFSGSQESSESRREAFSSPNKKLRSSSGLDLYQRVGLGIQYGRDA